MVTAEHEIPSKTSVVTVSSPRWLQSSLSWTLRALLSSVGLSTDDCIENGWLGHNGGGPRASSGNKCLTHDLFVCYFLFLSRREVGSSSAVCTTVHHRLETVGERPWICCLLNSVTLHSVLWFTLSHVLYNMKYSVLFSAKWFLLVESTNLPPLIVFVILFGIS